MSAHLATERALELLAPIQQADYVGWNGGGVGPKGQDETWDRALPEDALPPEFVRRASRRLQS